MVPICRSAQFLLPGVEKALPSRQPQTQAQQNAVAMMGHPTRQIQQGPTACPTCGHNHRAGTVCAAMKSIDFLDTLFKGVITISGQKRGNPYRDEGTGRFSASPNAGGTGGGGGGGATQENTVMGAPAPRLGGVLGTAKTEQGPAPSTDISPPAAPAPAGGTMPGKAAQNAPGVSPSMIARHEKQQGEDQAFMDALMKKPAQESAPKPVFSHEGAQGAYESEKARAMGAGASNEEAHAAGMKAGAAAYSNAIRPEGQVPAAPKGPGSTQSATPTMQGGAATAQSPAPPMGGAPAPGGSPPTVAGGGAAPAPIPSAPGGGSAMPTTPNKAPNNGKKQQGLTDKLTSPWVGAAGGIGAGMFRPGGTFGATTGGIQGSAHGLLQHVTEPKPASTQHQQQLKNAAGQSGAMQNQQAQHQGRQRMAAGQLPATVTAPQPPAAPPMGGGIGTAPPAGGSGTQQHHGVRP